MAQRLSKATKLPETASAHMVTHIPRVSVDTRISAVIESLHGQQFDCADTIFIINSDQKLEGIVRINDLFADGDRSISEIMKPEHEAVRLDDDQEQIAVLAMRLNMIAVPVVDNDGRLVGAVPPEALFKILRAEHMEDLQHMSGIMPHESGPDVALDAPLFNRFRRRIPWLIFGLFASSIITFVMVEFEDALSANVAVAFFVPAIVYIAGAIGSQAVSVAVRGLSSETVSIGRLLTDELVIGSGIGLTLGVIASTVVLVTFDSTALSLAVGFAVFGGGVISAVVGFGLPWAFQRFGSDPALGSGPICTIIQDVASLSLYFVLVSALIF
jgi:magnesium transporter